MPEDEKIAIEKPEGHYCFACGTANPKGLNLQFYRQGDKVCAEITLDRTHEGWENIAHGGIVSTLLDEVMSWAILYTKKDFYVTRKMDVKYVRPVMVGTSLTASGMVTDSSAPPKVRAKAEVRDDKGHLLVRGRGEFVQVSDIVPEKMKEDMLSVFEKFR